MLVKEAGLQAKTLSLDLRERVVAAVSSGMSCRQAVERFGVSAASPFAGIGTRWRFFDRRGVEKRPRIRASRTGQTY
jgi:transposase